MSRRLSMHAVLVLLVLATGTHTLSAQMPGVQPSAPRTRAELRLDAFSATIDAVHLGGGVGVPVGTYARVVGLLGAGVARAPGGAGDDDETGFSARAEMLVRFHFDPARQSRWGPYAAGGAVLRSDLEECCRGDLALLIGIEGPAASGRTWAVELGFGGGVRAALVLRGGGGRWR